MTASLDVANRISLKSEMRMGLPRFAIIGPAEGGGSHRRGVVGSRSKQEVANPNAGYRHSTFTTS
jgi:hypothetical protein